VKSENQTFFVADFVAKHCSISQINGGGRVWKNCWQNRVRNDKNNAKLSKVQSKISPGLSENDDKIILTRSPGK